MKTYQLIGWVFNVPIYKEMEEIKMAKKKVVAKKKATKKKK